MAAITIYHNGTCSKCKGALELIQERGIDHDVRWYMAEPLTVDELKELLDKLQMKAHELVRTSEELYKTAYENKDISDEEWLKILTEQPELMQRPIVAKGGQAIIARPPEKVLTML